MAGIKGVEYEVIRIMCKKKKSGELLSVTSLPAARKINLRTLQAVHSSVSLGTLISQL